MAIVFLPGIQEQKTTNWMASIFVKMKIDVVSSNGIHKIISAGYTHWV
ncbi:hypothetical protein BLA50215_07969 [Burkholderia lata]|nr:hypothetical protein BLA50215_07969 [Burkholderia lata]